MTVLGVEVPTWVLDWSGSLMVAGLSIWRRDAARATMVETQVDTYV